MVRVLVVGMGNMGISHARAYKSIDGFEIAGLCSRGIDARADVKAEFLGVPLFDDYEKGRLDKRSAPALKNCALSTSP